MALLANPDVQAVLMAILSAVFGYWLRHQQGGAPATPAAKPSGVPTPGTPSSGLDLPSLLSAFPADLAAIIQLLLARHAAAQQATAHEALQKLSQPVVTAGVVMPPSAVSPTATKGTS